MTARKPTYAETICCGHRRCPTVAMFEDGSLSISDEIAGALVRIEFSVEQAKRLRELLTLPTSKDEPHAESPTHC